MTDKEFEKAKKLADKLMDLSDSVIVISAFNLGENEKEEANKCIALSKGDTIRLAVILKHFLEVNKPVASAMKLLDLIPNAYRTEEIKDDGKN